MLSVLILAAGQGTRMISQLPKILHPIGGKPLVHHVIDVSQSLTPQQIVVVISPHLDLKAVRGGRVIDVVVQPTAQGTGDAVRCALSALTPDNDVLILCGDAPLITQELLTNLMKFREHHPDDVVVVGMRPENPTSYGRLVVNADGCIEKIVEEKDASTEEKKIDLCNSGVILVKQSDLAHLIPLLKANNKAGEYYLTDIIALSKKARVFEADSISLQGINNRVQLAQAEAVLQDRWRKKHMLAGVTMIDPSSVFLNHDTVIAADTVIYPQVVFGEGVVVGEGVTIYQSCYLKKTILNNGAKVGPFAHLREGTCVGERAEIGNFVETKNAMFGPFSKAKHLSYIGDAEIGAGANIGAGTITCNYDGYKKSKTVIGARAFIGSNTSLIAPVQVGEGAIVGAGSAVTGEIACDSLAISRSEVKILDSWAIQYRDKQVKKGK